MVEICAGSAVLSAEAQKKGFQVFPIDHAQNRFRAAASILVVDLTNPDAPDSLPLLSRRSSLNGVTWASHAALAAELGKKQLVQSCAKQEHRIPGLCVIQTICSVWTVSLHRRPPVLQLPMRSTALPKVLMYHIFLGIFISLENPERSWLWAILTVLVKRRPNPDYQRWFFGLVDINF